jgi:DHA1 family bicyclomycin/chloramphenicol resistance-like MFS transporter
MTMSLVNRRLVQRYALGDLLKAALVVASLAMVAMAFSVKLHHGGLVGIALCVFSFLHERRDCRHLNGGSAG